MSVGVGVGLVFLAREGVSFATLRRMETEEESAESAVLEQALAEESEREAAREGAPLSR